MFKCLEDVSPLIQEASQLSARLNTTFLLRAHHDSIINVGYCLIGAFHPAHL